MTEEEKEILSIVRLNKLLKKKEIRKKLQIGRLRIVFHWKSKKHPWGRFGGGWNWKFGFQKGYKSILFSLLVFSLWFQWWKEEKGEG